MARERIYDTELFKKHRPNRHQLKTDIMWLRLKFLKQNLDRAANRGDQSQRIDVSLDYLYKIGERQEWKCKLTGIPLEFTRGGTFWGRKWCNPKSCTIDRIDSNKGYVVRNIQLITWDINKIKGDVPNDELISLADLIVKNAKINQ